MLYQPPEKWTEELLKGLLGEDDRYEYKSGRIFVDKDEQSIKNSLAKEICAFANSFGGTLFIGVKDRSKEIDGVMKSYKNNTKEWLDKIISDLLEFRLPDYRVTEVKLTKLTQTRIGADKVVIAIDVSDSDLAPHQAKNDNKYYYRQSSTSNAAPHHYLAYLWSRTNQGKGDVVRSWCLNFLNPLLEMFDEILEVFQHLSLDYVLSQDKMKIITVQGIEMISEITFFSSDKWKNLFSDLSANQFLRTFPKEEVKCQVLKNHIDNFHNLFDNLKKSIIESSEFEELVRVMYERRMRTLNMTGNFNPRDLDFAHLLKLFAEELLNVPCESDDIKNKMGNMIVYSLFGCKPLLHQTDSTLFSVSHEHFSPKLKTIKDVQETLEKTVIAVRDIVDYSLYLKAEFENLRYSLAMRHNTTYF